MGIKREFVCRNRVFVDVRQLEEAVVLFEQAGIFVVQNIIFCALVKKSSSSVFENLVF